MIKNQKTVNSIFSFFLMLLSTIGFSQENFFSKSDAFFKQYVENGAVDYKAIKSNEAGLNELIRDISSFKTAAKGSNTIKTFYINAYNLLVIRGILDYYPVNSPMDIDGFFDEKKHTVAGEKLTLNDLENKKLRAPYKDARIHFVLVCAAQSCPPIINAAYLPKTLKQQLEQQTRFALNDPNFIRLDKSKKTAAVSEIFKWYEQDFLNEQASIKAYINKYRKEKIPEDYSITYYTYDWALNTIKR